MTAPASDAGADLARAIEQVQAAARALTEASSGSSFGLLARTHVPWTNAVRSLTERAVEAAQSLEHFAQVNSASGTTIVSYREEFQTAWIAGVSPSAANDHAASLSAALAERRALLRRVLAVTQIVASLAASGANPLAALGVIRQVGSLLEKAADA